MQPKGALRRFGIPIPFIREVPKPYMASQASSIATASHEPTGSLDRYRRFLLLVAGLGGLLYGVDVGIIGGALPYLEATSGLGAGQLSVIVAAVLLGGVFSTLFAGVLADWLGRKPLMVLSGVAFLVSIPAIALSHGYLPLFLGRLLQGMSGGFIGVVVPLYLAECLTAGVRGKGTAVFQWLLTLGIVTAACISIYYSYRVQAVAHGASTSQLFAFKDQAWRRIFWVSLPPGVLFVVGTFFVSESPRWLFRKGRKPAALAALLRSRTPAEAELELSEMERIAAEATATITVTHKQEPLLRRKYIVPFVLACVILACNTATGINSVIGYNTSILIQGGLSDIHAHWGYVVFTLVNFLATIVGVTLIDKKGRRFLFILGTSGIFVSVIGVGILFTQTEKRSVDARATVQALLDGSQQRDVSGDPSAAGKLSVAFNPGIATALLATAPDANKAAAIQPRQATLGMNYSCGDYTAASNIVRSDDAGTAPIEISRANCLPANAVEAFFKNPFGNLARSRTAPLRIESATISPIPNQQHGWLVALGLYLFMAFYAVGPGVCVWLALSELMPTRIRSNGMSIALVLNQAVSATLAAVFLPVVSKYGYSRMFFLFAAFTLVYFLVVTFFLPETKGQTLEEIEAHFDKGANVTA
jgi:SP family myo-inositol transporter-like MFS transporter 13